MSTTAFQKLLNISHISVQKPDIVFLNETSAGYNAIPIIRGYEIFADKEMRELNHGGIVRFVSSKLAPHCF